MSLFTSFQLKSRDADTRRRAVLKLGVAGRTSAIASLEPLVQDPDWRVREAAAQSLGAIGDAVAAPALLDAIRQADAVSDADGAGAVRTAAATALAQLGEGAVPALLEALRDRHARLREGAIEALGGIGGARSIEALTVALTDDRSNVRQAAAPALARAARVDAVPALRAALSHKDPATRRCAAAALGTVADGGSAAALRDALADRDRGVRDAALQALIRQGGPGAVEVLCRAVLEGDRELRTAAAGALKNTEWTPAGPQQRVVHAVLHGQYAQAAAEGEAALAPLVAALSDRDAAVRAAAARALGLLADERSAEMLVRLLGDGDAAVRGAAVEALVKVGPASGAALARALDDPTPAARTALRSVVAGIGAAPLVDGLAARLEVGETASHAGIPLRLVHQREQLDATRAVADALEALVPYTLAELPRATLDRLARVPDVMLVEQGEVPSASDRVSCEKARALGAGGSSRP